MNIDYDLEACLQYHTDIISDDVAEVLAVYEGWNDGDSWHWIVRLKDNTYAYITGWCDYTGWDCRSGGRAYRFTTVDALVAAGNIEQDDNYVTCLEQLKTSKAVTWREQMDVVFADALKPIPSDMKQSVTVRKENK